ncbi:MAG: hypothetical protein OHK0053_31050 [Microscillaceae bacterium]
MNTSMKSLRILETKKTPAINFDYQRGRLEITGFRSMPEIATNFYRPIISWLREYVQAPATGSTVLSLKLEYFNTGSGKCLVEMFKMLDQLAAEGHPVYLKWFYEEDDEDMLQSADDIEILLKNIVLERIPYQDPA